MKIRMLQTIQGTLDGATVGELEVGQEYDTADTPAGTRAAEYHVQMGHAEYAPDSAAKPAPRAKAK